MYLVKVLVEYRNLLLDKTFDYYSEQLIPKYSRVLIPFNNRDIVGFVVAIEEMDKTKQPDFALKEIKAVIDDEPIINDELFALSQMMADKYLVSQIQALQTILPTGLKPKHNNEVHDRFEVYLVAQDKSTTHNSPKLTPKQQAAYEALCQVGKIKQSDFKQQYSYAIINALADKGYLVKENLKKEYALVNEEQSTFKTLNEEQAKIYQKIIAQEDTAFLLHGITGSGKTEIYLHLARHYLQMNKTVLILVPEITLTLLMQERFASRFQNEIAILHSRLSNPQRYQEYQKIIAGQSKIVVGTRSSIFAPLSNIGVIIIDEEHDNSYKQKSGIMYKTHDVADFRAKYHQANVVYASATPSVTSLAMAHKKRYQYLVLNQRFLHQPLPNISLVDMNYESLDHIVSDKVLNTMQDYLNRDKQIIVLLNRRGYHQLFKCRDCNETQMCPHCNVALTYHQPTKSLQCHHCGYKTQQVNKCFYCGSTNIKKMGFGIQKIEETLINHFKGETIIRIDQDSIQNTNVLQEKLDAFKAKKAHILIGTQMIAKGLDFEDVDLVVVLNIDASLGLNSYDAVENAFALLVQVAGRAGRFSGKGQVLIETYLPDHYAIQYALHHDYLGFFNYEMKIRQKYENPPYFKESVVLLSGYDENKVNLEADTIYRYLNGIIEEGIVINNGDYFIYKLANSYRQQIIIKYKNFAAIKDVLLNLKKSYSQKKDLNISIDTDL